MLFNLTVRPARIAALALAAAAVAGIATSSALAQTTSAATSTRAIHTEGVTLLVPGNWQLSTSMPGCITAPGAAKPTAAEAAYGAGSCQLQVITGKSLDARPTLESLYFQGDPAVCHKNGTSLGWATTLAGTERDPHATLEFRSFDLPCSSRPAEQWFAAGPPGVLIQRTFADKSTESAARQAVESAVLPAQRVGLSRSVSSVVTRVDGNAVVAQPVRLYVSADHRYSLNDIWGPSYRYTLDAHTYVTYTDAGHDLFPLTSAQYLHYLKVGFPNAGKGNKIVSTFNSYTGSHLDDIKVDVASTS